MNAESMRFFQRLFEKQARRMRNIVARGIVSLVQDGLKMQTSQIKLLDGEIIEGAERAQQYGFTSHPHAGAECFVVFAGADRSHPLILAVDDRRYRIRALPAGEVCLYTDEGDTIHFKRGNVIEAATKHFVINAENDVTINTQKVAVNTQTYTVNAAASVSYLTPSWSVDSTDGSVVTARMRANLDQDGWHQTTGDQIAGSVSQKTHVHGGVQTGNGTTAVPVGGG